MHDKSQQNDSNLGWHHVVIRFILDKYMYIAILCQIWIVKIIEYKKLLQVYIG